MAEHTSNDNAAHARGGLKGPDPHGQAAMLLVESLIHGLIANSALTIPEAVEIVDTAAEVKEEVAADLGDSPATMQKSLALLTAIRESLSQDIAPG